MHADVAADLLGHPLGGVPLLLCLFFPLRLYLHITLHDYSCSWRLLVASPTSSSSAGSEGEKTADSSQAA